MSEALRVAVLKGGRSLERAVSLRSGAHVQEALQRFQLSGEPKVTHFIAVNAER